MENLTILWLDDKRDPYKYFAKMEKDKKANKELSGAGARNNKFYQNNIYAKYNVTFEWVKNLDEFAHYIMSNGLPQFISFDRDLTPKGWNDTHTEAFPDGLACIKWLKQYCDKNNLQLPRCYVHSANWNHIPEMQQELGSAALHQAYEFTKNGKTKSIDERILREKIEHMVRKALNEYKIR